LCLLELRILAPDVDDGVVAFDRGGHRFWAEVEAVATFGEHFERLDLAPLDAARALGPLFEVLPRDGTEERIRLAGGAPIVERCFRPLDPKMNRTFGSSVGGAPRAGRWPNQQEQPEHEEE
jgi:hypothetical protein